MPAMRLHSVHTSAGPAWPHDTHMCQPTPGNLFEHALVLWLETTNTTSQNTNLVMSFGENVWFIICDQVITLCLQLNDLNEI